MQILGNNKVEIDLASVEPWNPTMAQLRESALHFELLGPDFSRMVDPKWRGMQVTHWEIEHISANLLDAFLAGRVLDFGHIPNEVIKATASPRAGRLWNDGHIGYPFSEPYVIVHTWNPQRVWELKPDGTAEGHEWRLSTSVYLVNPLDGPLGDVEVVEMQPNLINAREPGRSASHRRGMLMIGDRGRFDRTPGEWKQVARITPFLLRFLEGVPPAVNNGETPQEAASSNIADPLLCTLMILNTRGIERHTVEPSDKLNRARRKNGKLPIPPYDVVKSSPYVTAVLARGAPRPAQEHQGGTHASPVMHLRMGHPRTYASGNSIFVRDALVNATPEAKAAFRSHYKVAAQPPA